MVRTMNEKFEIREFNYRPLHASLAVQFLKYSIIQSLKAALVEHGPNVVENSTLALN